MTRPQETFTDMLARLFPMPGIQLGINSPHSKCITFQVTEDCNLRCSYCYQGCKTHRKMSLETAKAAVDMLLAADERTNQYITSTEVAGVVLDFIGGEPLLEVELIDQILDYFVAQTFRLHHPWATRWKASMSTNGTLYFRPEVQRFLDKWAKHLSLSISIDGDKQLHDSCRVFPDGSGSYDLAIAAAKDYMTKGNALGSKMTIAPGNVDYLYHAVIGLLDAGYRAINLNCVYEKGWTLDHAATLYTQLKRLADFVLLSDEQPYLSIFSESIGHPLSEDDNQNWCGGTGLMLAVDCDGLFFPCLRYMGTSLGHEQRPYAIGDLEHGINVLPEHRARVAEMAAVTRRSQSTDECFNCPIASGCSWCSAYNYQCTGTPDQRVTYICPMHKARVLANAYYNKRMYAGEIAPEKAAKCVKAEYAAIGLSNVVAYDYFSAAVGAFFTRKTLMALSTDEKLAWVKTIFEQNERCGCQRVKDALFIYCLRLLSHMGIVTADLSFTNLVMREINAITEDRKNAAIMPQALVTEL